MVWHNAERCFGRCGTMPWGIVIGALRQEISQVFFLLLFFLHETETARRASSHICLLYWAIVLITLGIHPQTQGKRCERPKHDVMLLRCTHKAFLFTGILGPRAREANLPYMCVNALAQSCSTYREDRCVFEYAGTSVRAVSLSKVFDSLPPLDRG